MTKITVDHLARGAFVYIRQSTPDQLVHNQESQRRQYGLADRAKQLGWATVEIIDDDLGRSGGGIARPGFERLLAAICEARVGAVFAIEASRLARNGRDWHTLIEFCGLVGTVIVDEDGIYDPRYCNDRLLLGMKGTMSELELALFRQRSQEALKQKARRGALFLGVAAGYVKTGRDRIEKDPDQQVQGALRIVFAKFAELQSVRQVHVWLRDEGIALPTACHSTAEARSVVWRLPLYNTVHNILTNPVYAGAYAFGRTTSKVSVEEGRKRGQAWRAPAIGRVGRAAQGSTRGLYLLGRVREEPAGDCQQCDRQGKCRRQRSCAAWGVAPCRPSALWPLRSQNVCGLWRQSWSLSLRGCSRQPRHRALHLVRRHARR
jgi:DNA invertase Pin-like site-specific DNA recombinase